MNPAFPRPWKAVIVSAAAFAFVCKILLALNTFGTNDVYAWERFAHWSRIFGAGIYQADPAFNHPPSMIHALAVMTWLADTTGVFFPFWMRLPAILADSASLWIVYRIFARRLDQPSIRWTLLLMALSPVLILVSGFHGNTDPVVMFFLLLSVWLTEEDQSDWLSGAAFGAAMCVKVLPLIVLPVFFFCRPGLHRRAVFLFSAAAVILLCWSPYLFHDPVAIVHQVFGYQSIYGDWGLSWLAYHERFFRDSWHDLFHHNGAYFEIAIIAIWSFVVNRSTAKPSVYAQTGIALFFFLAVSTGFGVQYLAWLVPWTVGVAVIPVAFFFAASAAFLFLTYNYWAGGFPWYLADANYKGDFTPHLDYFLVLCWFSVICLAWAAWLQRPLSFPARRTRLALGVLAIPLLLYPTWKQFRADTRTYATSIDHAAIDSIRAGEQAMLSAQYYKRGRYTEAVVAARIGVALDPTQLDSWNSLTQACIQLGKWDEATNAATQAIQIAPDNETANQNLTHLGARH